MPTQLFLIRRWRGQVLAFFYFGRFHILGYKISCRLPIKARRGEMDFMKRVFSDEAGVFGSYEKGRRKGFILNLSSVHLAVAISLPANLLSMAQAPNRNRGIIQRTTKPVNTDLFSSFSRSPQAGRAVKAWPAQMSLLKSTSQFLLLF